MFTGYEDKIEQASNYTTTVLKGELKTFFSSLLSMGK